MAVLTIDCSANRADLRFEGEDFTSQSVLYMWEYFFFLTHQVLASHMWSDPIYLSFSLLFSSQTDIS